MSSVNSFLLVANSSLNIVIYSFFNNQFRAGARELLRWDKMQYLIPQNFKLRLRESRFCLFPTWTLSCKVSDIMALFFFAWNRNLSCFKMRGLRYLHSLRAALNECDNYDWIAKKWYWLSSFQVQKIAFEWPVSRRHCGPRARLRLRPGQRRTLRRTGYIAKITDH